MSEREDSEEGKEKDCVYCSTTAQYFLCASPAPAACRLLVAVGGVFGTGRTHSSFLGGLAGGSRGQQGAAAAIALHQTTTKLLIFEIS